MAQSNTIFQRIEEGQEEIKKKIEVLEVKAKKKAEKEAKKERIMESARVLNFWDKLKLHIKIGL